MAGQLVQEIESGNLYVHDSFQICDDENSCSNQYENDFAIAGCVIYDEYGCARFETASPTGLHIYVITQECKLTIRARLVSVSERELEWQ